jgi:hypothetical protein
MMGKGRSKRSEDSAPAEMEEYEKETICQLRIICSIR